ncbi:hypothetical protein DMB95_01530 [Campylobacter sp. MIT 12-8780]|uniref:hypothetical protein n=1 Tax=unclassified Campylobacter TaxID=2593542 RepID=UPI00115E7987|nr:MULTISPECIES: hypothetical protein [unclassified Campylobacter]NDJ28133.1 hypothetical protein [Campylobacter sp. MIT 19-121]TQR42322.1 hypothetical protein DMB95_01530 [Campylobacter sp. MIT 12-8780]
MRICILVFFTLLFSACASKVESFIQTSNEGIFIKTTLPKSVSINLQNPAQIPNTLQTKLENALVSKGFSIATNANAADFEILLNLVDFRKFSYARKINSGSVGFIYGPFMRVDYDYEVENFYLLQVNIQITNTLTKEAQKTSLIARTSFLANTKESKASLEDKIITQILSFFYVY